MLVDGTGTMITTDRRTVMMIGDTRALSAVAPDTCSPVAVLSPAAAAALAVVVAAVGAELGARD